MSATPFTPVESSLGGAMIGAASALSLALNGKIPGISGICARALQCKPNDTAWRLIFLLGMVMGGLVARAAYPAAGEYQSSASFWLFGVAGLIVGVGTRVGGGCTSGHGICGIGRGSPPSMLATCLFMAVAAATVYVMRHVMGSWR